MANTFSNRHGADLFPTYSGQGQPTSARMRQAYDEDVEEECEGRYNFQPLRYQAATTENLEWHSIELTPMLGQFHSCFRILPADITSCGLALHAFCTVGYLGCSLVRHSTVTNDTGHMRIGYLRMCNKATWVE
jgi:hypothetical protein